MKNPLHHTDVSEIADLAKYLARPYRHGTYTLSQTASAKIVTLPLTLSAYYDNHPNWSRTRGAFGMRATACFRLEIAATPQHSGIIRMCLDPTSTGKRSDNPMQISYLPGVEVNINNTLTAELRCPYISPFTFMNLAGSAVNNGTLYVYCMTAIGTATGATAPTCTLWTWLEDIEFVAPTAGATKTITPAAITSRDARLEDVQPHKPILPPLDDYTLYESEIVDQSGSFVAPRKAGFTVKEAQPASLSSLLASGSFALNLIKGTGIPLLSGLAGMASWATSIAANAASAYGWSRPRGEAKNKKVYSSRNTGQFNISSINNSHSLALTSDPTVDVFPIAGSGIDEMSFEYLFGHYGVISSLNWAASAAVDTDIYYCNVTPLTFNYQSGNNVYTAQPSTSINSYLSPMNYVADSFKYWRGNVKFRIKLASTKFHSGKLLVGFIPTNRNVLDWTSAGVRIILPTPTTAFDFKSVVWDIRSEVELEFEVPFIATTPYTNTTSGIGTFFIRVIEKLNAPTNVPNTVPILVEVKGTPSFELAALDYTQYITSQANDFAAHNTPTASPSTSTIGEKIMSLKQMISRAVPFDIQQKDIDTKPNTSAGQYYLPRLPFNCALDSTAFPGFKYWKKWQQFYAFQRGSTNYTLMAPDKDTHIIARTALYNADQFSDAILISEADGTLHFTIPYAGTTPYVSTHLGTGDYFALIDWNSPKPLAVFISAGDDYQMGYFCGLPPVTQQLGVQTPEKPLMSNWLGRAPYPVPPVTTTITTP